MRRAVLLVGGWAHPGDDHVAAVSALLAERSFETHVVREPSEVPTAIDDGCDLLVVGACWFAMTDARYTADQRRDHAVPFGNALEASLRQLRDHGCPLLALHTAVICFDGHDTWTNWLGATWNWDRSWHPEPAPVLVAPAPDTPISFGPFTVTDELYQDLDLHSGSDVVAVAHGHPVVWVRQNATGKSAVNLLGHDSRSLEYPAHLDLHGQLIDWLVQDSSAARRQHG